MERPTVLAIRSLEKHGIYVDYNSSSRVPPSKLQSNFVRGASNFWKIPSYYLVPPIALKVPTHCIEGTHPCTSLGLMLLITGTVVKLFMTQRSAS